LWLTTCDEIVWQPNCTVEALFTQTRDCVEQLDIVYCAIAYFL